MQPVEECGDTPLAFRIIFAQSGEHADPPHPVHLLRRAAKQPLIQRLL
jgi:hypothetical protein